MAGRYIQTHDWQAVFATVATGAVDQSFPEGIRAILIKKIA